MKAKWSYAISYMLSFESFGTQQWMRTIFEDKI